jgi:hypothetical protein
MLQTKTCGHILSPNIVNSQYFGNLVCLHVVQNGLQATSTPRTAFHQEGEDDEDMASTHMTILGELHGGQGDQQGHPNREGGPKLIRFESPRWRPKSSSSPPRNPGLVCLELVTQDTFGLCFRWSIYGWKAYLIRKPIQVVPRQKLFGINGNRRNKSLSRIYQGAVSPSFGLFGPCNVSALPRDANRGPLTSLSLYNQ